MSRSTSRKSEKKKEGDGRGKAKLGTFKPRAENDAAGARETQGEARKTDCRSTWRKNRDINHDSQAPKPDRTGRE